MGALILRGSAMLAALALGLSFVSAALAAPGDIDASFGSAGRASVSFAPASIRVGAVAQDAAGRVVIAGEKTLLPWELLVARFSAAGTLDSTFGTAGKALVAFPPATVHAIVGIAEQAGGKLIVAGTFEHAGLSGGISRTWLTLVRLTTSGSADMTFGMQNVGMGWVVRPGNATANAMAVQADGKLLVAGYIDQGPYGWNAIVGRFTADGMPDPSFGPYGNEDIDVMSAGSSVIAIAGQRAFVGAVAEQSDGKVLLAGQLMNPTTDAASFFIARLEANGYPDRGFGSDGVVITPMGFPELPSPIGVVQQADGKLIIAGSAIGAGGRAVTLVRYLANGALDTTFGAAGIVRVMAGVDMGNAVRLFSQPDGKLVATGFAQSGGSLVSTLARFHPDGSLDSSFGVGGLVMGPPGAALMTAAARGSDGNVVTAGSTDELMVVERYQTAMGSSAALSLSAHARNIRRGLDMNATIGGGATTGVVAFVDGAVPIPGCGAVAVVAGAASCSTDSLPLGMRSLRARYTDPTMQYAPAISAPVSVLIRLPGTPDFNNDGSPDLVWSNPSTGATFLWHMEGAALQSDRFLSLIDPSWRVAGSGDFNDDGHVDLVWRNEANGNTFVWYMEAGSFASDAFLFGLPPQWIIEGVADFNADGKPDFLLRSTTTGVGFAWFFDNGAPIGDQFLFGIDPSWKVEQVSDLNGDDQPDLLFRNASSGLSFAWFTVFSAGTLSLGGSTAPLYSIDPVWEVVQLADWNADGQPDLVFRNAETGVVFVWYMSGTSLAGSDFIIQIDPSWEIVPRR